MAQAKDLTDAECRVEYRRIRGGSTIAKLHGNAYFDRAAGALARRGGQSSLTTARRYVGAARRLVGPGPDGEVRALLEDLDRPCGNWPTVA